MKSKMSFFDPTLLKKNIGRFAPAWAILQVAMFLAFPMSLMLELQPRGLRPTGLLRPRDFPGKRTGVG